MAQGRSTEIISMIEWIRTSRLPINNSLSPTWCSCSLMYSLMAFASPPLDMNTRNCSQGSAFKIQGSEFRVQGTGFREQGLDMNTRSCSGVSFQNFVCAIQGLPEHKIHHAVGAYGLSL